MNGAALHPTPRPRAVASAQLRTVGLALRRELLAGALLLSAATLVLLVVAVPAGRVLALGDVGALGLVAGAVALLFPAVVWKGEARFGSSPLWLLPVGHRRHALAKVAAGWGWLMLVVAVLVGWIVAAVVVTGGAVGWDEMRPVLDPADPSRTLPVRWTTPWWQWLAPFAGATALYLLSSALRLATRRPWLWAAGAVLVFVLVVSVGEQQGVPWLQGAAEDVVEVVAFSPYGLDTVLTGGAESLEVAVPLPSGGVDVVWRGVPTFGRWASATLVWLGLGVAAVVAAAARPRAD